jgi:hypothetical protein
MKNVKLSVVPFEDFYNYRDYALIVEMLKWLTKCIEMQYEIFIFKANFKGRYDELTVIGTP